MGYGMRQKPCSIVKNRCDIWYLVSSGADVAVLDHGFGIFYDNETLKYKLPPPKYVVLRLEGRRAGDEQAGAFAEVWVLGRPG